MGRINEARRARTLAASIRARAAKANRVEVEEGALRGAAVSQSPVDRSAPRFSRFGVALLDIRLPHIPAAIAAPLGSR